MSEIKKCIICGRTYKFCGHCNKISSSELWRNLYCCEDCREIFDTCSRYEGKSLSANEAYDRLVKCGFANKKIQPSVKGTVEKILGNIVKVDDTPTEELKTKVEEPVTEEEKPKRKYRRCRTKKTEE